MQSTLFSRLVETADLSLLGATNVTDASATAAARQGTVSACGAFGLRLTDTVWGEHTGNTGNHVSLYFLTQFTVTFDFPNRRVLLEKNTNFGHADMVDLSGLHFRRVDGNIVIESVDGGSPADKAGIRAGDRIKSVNSQDSTRARLFALRESLSQPGERVDVVLQRGKDIVRRQFELPNRLATRADRSRKATHRFASRPASN
jgi:hypothetical protein